MCIFIEICSKKNTAFHTLILDTILDAKFDTLHPDDTKNLLDTKLK